MRPMYTPRKEEVGGRGSKKEEEGRGSGWVRGRKGGQRGGGWMLEGKERGEEGGRAGVERKASWNFVV